MECRGVSFLLYCNLCTREPIFNLKMFPSLRISNRVKYGVAFSLLSAKKMQRRHLLWLIFIFFNLVWHAVPQLINPVI